MAERRRRNISDRVSLDWFNALGSAQEKHAEALAGGAAFVLLDQYSTHLQNQHPKLSYEVYDPDAGRKYPEGLIRDSLDFACRIMAQVKTINEIETSPLWKNKPKLLPAFSQAVKLVLACPQCQK